MAYFLCSRASAPSISFIKQLKEPSRPINRCLHHATPSTRHRRPFLIPKNLHPQRNVPSSRAFATSPSHSYKTIEEARSKSHSGPFSARSAILFLTVGAIMIVYFRFEKDRLERKKIADAAKGVGKPKVGGKFELMDQSGRTWTEGNLKGGFTLVSWDFSLSMMHSCKKTNGRWKNAKRSLPCKSSNFPSPLCPQTNCLPPFPFR